MVKRLVLIGGGHAHMVTLANLARFTNKGFEVTVIQPSAYHYYSGMGPGMLSRIYKAEEIRFATRHVVEKQGGHFVLGKAVTIDPVSRTVTLEDGETLGYDVLSCNAGSYVPVMGSSPASENTYSVKPIEKLLEAQSRLLELAAQRPITVGIVGGGPSAVEIAGNAWRLLRDYGTHAARIQVFAGTRLMNRLPEDIRRRAHQSLSGRGIEIVESSYVKDVQGRELTLESGERYALDFIFMALGVKPSRIFAESDLPMGPDGGLLVNEYLQCTRYPEIFGGGDCIYFEKQPLDKVGVYAVRENPILWHNLLSYLEEQPLRPFDPGGDYLLIYNMGDGTGILKKKSIVFGGRLAFIIKDYIDRKFIRTFQAIE